MSDTENLKDKLHTAAAFSPASDMAPGVAEKLKKRPQPPLTSEPETPTRARQLHADDAKESGLTEQSPTSDGSPKGRPQQARAPPAEYPPPPSDDLLWGGQAVADFLGISLDRLYYLIRVKRLPIAQLGRKTIVASKKKLQRALADTLAA